VLGGKYRLERELGRGGMGVVFRATHLRLGKPVAIKMLLPEALSSPGAVERFDREARAAAQIKSQHVAEVLDIDHHQGLPYMVLEFLEGHDLSVELTRRGPLPASEVVDWLLQVCTAMDEAHKRGIVHRDLKPSNIFLAEQDGHRTIKILDFGISKITSPHEARLTATTEGFGTVLYMSPEQVRSTRETDARGDVWSLGVIAYELLSNRAPFVGESATAIVASIMVDPFPPLGSLRPDLPAGLAEVVHHALVKDRNQRTQSMAEFAAALAPFGSGRVSVIAPSVSHDLEDATTLRKTPRFGRRAWWGAGALAAGLGVVAVLGLKAQGREQEVTRSAPAASAPALASASTPASASVTPSTPEVTSEPPEASPQPRASAGAKSKTTAKLPPVPPPPGVKRTGRLD
jgi:serine/threonine-protein kinase